MNSRRTILKNIGLGAAVATVAAGGAHALRAPRPASPPEQGGAPWWLLRPLARGSHLGLGWVLAHLSAVDRGAIVLTLQHREGGVARVHICRHEGRPKGLAHTELLDLVLMDGGRGDRPTDEGLGRVLLGLAAHIRENELADGGDLSVLARLQCHEDRILDHGPETLT